MSQFQQIQPGDTFELKVISQIYRDTYKANVISIDDQTITISMPISQGKMALLSVGTPIEINCTRHNLTFQSEVLARGFKPQPNLVIQIPYKEIHNENSRAQVITVTSGKGGVGKTTFTINLAISLAKLNKRVFVIDADLGTANVDVLLNLQPKYNLTHIINKEKDILDIIVEGPGGIYLVPGGSGLQGLADMEEWQFNRLVSSLHKLEKYADIILIDTGAGLGKNVINFALAADNILIVTTPEPHSITDAYAIIKVLDDHNHVIPPNLIINRSHSVKEYQEVSDKMVQVVNRFLNLKMKKLGYILEDTTVPKANRALKQLVLDYPNAPASKCIDTIAQELISPNQENSHLSSQQTFFTRIKDLFYR